MLKLILTTYLTTINAWYVRNWRYQPLFPNFANSLGSRTYSPNYYYTNTNIQYPRNPVYKPVCDEIFTSQTKRGSVGTMGLRNSGSYKCWEIKGASYGSSLRAKLTHLKDVGSICGLKINGKTICNGDKL